MTTQRLHVFDKTVQIVAVIRDVLTRMITVSLDEIRNLGFLGAIDAFDQCDAEVAKVDAPDFHAAVRISRARVIDTLYQGAAFHNDVKPGPFFDAAVFDGVRNMIDLSQV
jgi:hypothetical protein